MSVNIQTANGLKLLADKTTKKKVISALGYTPANAQSIININDDQSGSFKIVDLNNNIIFIVDENGVTTTKIKTTEGFYTEDDNLKIVDSNNNTIFQVDQNGITTTKVTTYDIENGDDNLIIKDLNGNIIFKIDENGVNSIDYLIKGKSILTTIQESVFSGDYNDLINKPIETNGDDEEFTIVDKNNNIIVKIDASGINTTAFLVNGKNISELYLSLNGGTLTGDVTFEGDVTFDRGIYVGSQELSAYIKSNIDLSGYLTISDASLTYLPREDESDSFSIIDKDNNIILQVDKNGINTIAYLVNGVDISTIYVKNTDYATSSKYGLVKIGNTDQYIESAEAEFVPTCEAVASYTTYYYLTKTSASSTYATITKVESLENEITKIKQMGYLTEEKAKATYLPREDEEDSLKIVDSNDNIIFEINKLGINTVEYYQNGISLSNIYLKINDFNNLKGANNGIATLDSSGKVPSTQLPSYVDDIIEGYLSPTDNTVFATDTAWLNRIEGESGKIYVDISNNKTYRWSGTQFTIISESLALGETTGTAYDGGKGATNRVDINKLLSYFNQSGYALRAIADSAGNPFDTYYVTMSNLSATLQNYNAQILESVSNSYALKTEAIGSFSVSGKTITYKSVSGKTLGTFETQDTSDYNELTNKPIENEEEDKSLIIKDLQDNIIAQIDANGINTIAYYIKGVNVVDTFARKDSLDDYLTTDEARTTYATTASLTNYATQSYVSTNYARKDSISDMLTKTEATSIYFTIRDWQSNSSALQQNIAQTYATQASLSSYLLSSTAESTYLKKTDKYILPQATSDTLGGVKVGYEDNGKAYGIKLDTNGKMYVYVDWQNTEYSQATSSALGLVYMDSSGRCLDVEEGKGIVPDGASIATYIETYTYDKSTIDKKVAEAITGGTIDLSGYLTKDEARKTYASFASLTNYATQSYVSTNYARKDSISDMLTKTEATSIYFTIRDWQSNSSALQQNIAQTYATQASLSGYLKTSDYVVDSALSLTSTNPVQNKVIATAIENIEKDYVVKDALNDYLPKSNGEATGLKVKDSIELGEYKGTYGIELTSTDNDRLAVNGNEVAYVGDIPDVSDCLKKESDGDSFTLVDSNGNIIFTIDQNGVSTTNVFSNGNVLATFLEVEKLIVESKPKTEVIFETSTSVYTALSAGNTKTTSITLTKSVRAGDRLKVYVNGGSSYPTLQAGIIELELYNPTSSTLVGQGSFMSISGGQKLIIGAEVNASSTTTTTLKINVYALANSDYAGSSQVYVSKVERIR